MVDWELLQRSRTCFASGTTRKDLYHTSPSNGPALADDLDIDIVVNDGAVDVLSAGVVIRT